MNEWVQSMHQVKTQATLCGICSGQIVNGKGSPPSTLVERTAHLDKTNHFRTYFKLCQLLTNLWQLV
jgi:hypothetical protein